MTRIACSESVGPQIPVLLEYCARVAGRLQTTRLIRWAEIMQHQKADDLWLLIDGRVYDCTSWLPLHPGGKSLLLGLGKDATYLFEMCAVCSCSLQYLTSCLAPLF